MSITSSRVFTNGNSQAVRIPQEFRLDTSLVEISKNKNGDLIIHPIPEDKGAALFEALSRFDDDFIEVLEQEQHDQPTPQDRDDL